MRKVRKGQLIKDSFNASWRAFDFVELAEAGADL
jgi:hypothetical protein